METAVKKIVILGSTGSIGTQALEVIRHNRERFEVIGLVAGSNYELLEKQKKEFSPKYTILADKLSSNDTSVQDLCREIEVSTVLGAIVGVAGLLPIEAAIESGKEILLANKESLVCAGKILTDKARASGAKVIPVDSEHSAIFQILNGENRKDLKKVILTASGGPFRTKSLNELKNVTVAEAINHPRWSMGRKISVDSATLMNKALEVIEAKWLFDLKPEQIEVLIHPESIVHSLVEFVDGVQIAHCSVPDMKGAISYALCYPEQRLRGAIEPLKLQQIKSLNFEEVCFERFPALRLAYSVLKKGDGACAVFNLANEVAVLRFLDGKLPFMEIVNFVEETVIKLADRKISSISDIINLKEEIWSI